jgi:hypothetical protein
MAVMSKSLQLAINNWKAEREDNNIPRCFPENDWEAWVNMEDIMINTLPIRQFGCRDCTTKYQKEMTLLNKCCNPQLRLAGFAD